jgi:pimeloyl-ACP methyl ester carboxylesterase
MRSLGPAASLACLAACGASQGPPVPWLTSWSVVAPLPCAVKGVGRPALCGVVTVPEDRASRAGRALSLDIVVVPAADKERAQPDPLFVLAGGPGQAATELAAQTLEVFASVAETRDIVFVDQRGTGRHSPLRCSIIGDDGDIGTLAGGVLPEERLRDCLAHMDARPELYTTSVAVDDYDEIAVRLGYDRVNLFGGSYGTEVAQEMMRRHPERVRAVVLDAVSPVDVDFVVAYATNAQHVFDAVADECAHDPACHGAFPDPSGDLQRALAHYHASPARVSAPVRGQARATATLDANAVAMTVRLLLYSADTRGWVPAIVHAAAAGDDAAIAPYVVRGAALAASAMSVGLYLSVTCAEDVAGLTELDAERATAGTFLGTARVGPILRACAFWPRGSLPPDFHQPVRSDAPVLFLNGTLDPATPAALVDHLRASLPNARTVIVPGGAHGVSDEGCLPGVVARFLDAPAAPLDTSCVAPVATKFILEPRPGLQ